MNQFSDTRHISEADLRRWAERLIGEISDEHWSYAAEDGLLFYALAEDRAEDRDDLLTAIKKFRRRHGSPTPRARRISPPEQTPAAAPKARERILSETVALLAANRPDVIRFRLRYLTKRRWSRPITLLEPHQVADWIDDRTRTPTQWVEVALPVLGEEIEIPAPFPGKGLRHLAFEIPDHGDAWTIRVVATTAGGVLEELRALSAQLSGAFGWWRSSAATWVLTGDRVPEVHEITYRLEARDPSAMSRVVLNVDPTVTPAELAGHWRRIRAKTKVGVHRDMSERTLRLAFFALSRRHESWQASMEDWNAREPNSRFTERWTFQARAREAAARLLEPGHGLRVGVAAPGRPAKPVDPGRLEAFRWAYLQRLRDETRREEGVPEDERTSPAAQPGSEALSWLRGTAPPDEAADEKG